jgi:hypothetical protein
MNDVSTQFSLPAPSPKLPHGVYGSDTLGKLFEALAKARVEFKVAKFDSKNPHFKNEFASLTSIDEATVEPLSKYGLAVTQQPYSDESGAPRLFTILGHASGEWIGGDLKLILSKQDMQALGASVTYAKRYAKSAAIGVVSDKDDDGESAVSRSVSQPAQQQNVQPAPTQESQFVDEGERDDRLVSQAQAKMIYAKAKAKKIPDDKLKDILIQVSGVRETSQVPWMDVSKILNEIAAFGSH